MDSEQKSVAQLKLVRDVKRPIFDNPLSKEFLYLEEVAEFFRVSQRWIVTQVSLGRLPCHYVGRSTKLFHLPEVRKAILADVLAQSKGKNYDRSKSQKQKRKHQLPSQYQSSRTTSLQELRQQRACSALE